MVSALRRFSPWLLAVAAAGCVLDEVPLAGRGCELPAHPCVRGFECLSGQCVACSDHDGDGHLSLACAGLDCDDADRAVKPCVKGVTRACVNDCGKAGTESCEGSCTWSACVVEEICDGEDNDCDGVRDEGFACIAEGTAECTTSCGSTGSAACSAQCAMGTCVPPEESCNGLDDDCAGGADDGFFCVQGALSDEECATVCGGVGRLACNEACDDRACAPAGEQCNGLDDDCGGGVDEGLDGDAGLLAPEASEATAVALCARAGQLAFAYATSDAVFAGLGPAAAFASPGAVPRVRVSAAGAAPRDPDVALGEGTAAVVWSDGTGSQVTVRLALLSTETGAVVPTESFLGAARAGVQPRVAWLPGGGGRFAVTWISANGVAALTLLDAGGAARVKATGLPSVHALARMVGVAAHPDGGALLGLATGVGSGSMTPQLQHVGLDGVPGATENLSATFAGMLRDEGVDLAAFGDTLVAAWAVVDSADRRQVAATTWQRGQAPAPAGRASLPTSPVSGSVRAAAQRDGFLVAWAELTETDPPEARLAAATRFREGALRTRRLDEVAAGYQPSFAFPSTPAWDGTRWWFAWIDGAVVLRQVCP